MAALSPPKRGSAMQVPDTTRAIVTPFVILFLVGLISPALLTIAVVVGTHAFSSVAPEWVSFILNLVRSFNGVGSQMVAIVAASLPALASAICFTSHNSTALTRAGKAALVLM